MSSMTILTRIPNETSLGSLAGITNVTRLNRMNRLTRTTRLPIAGKLVKMVKW